ncbi:ChaN family lipoprotein [Neomegalonema perideroedes]|uniref:ChaN family lipoprotein n=1 Tax=Neomegalonema perideroedes TaxID=217219 RepID=UPI00036C68B3|nr:ChaN family lipoprotein [Neomegalonema perideroedes]
MHMLKTKRARLAAGFLTTTFGAALTAFAALGAPEAAAQRAGEPPEPGRVYTGEGRWIGGLPDLAARLAETRFVAIGETHDNPDHHRIQAALTASIKPEVLAFEMFPEDGEEALNDLRAFGASRERLAGALDWEERGWGDWDFYAQILEAAPWADVTGGGLPRDLLRRVSAEGLSAAPEALVARYGLDEPLAPEDQAELTKILNESHCGHLPASRVGGMSAVQRLWDASFAEAWARGAGEEGRGVLIAGAAHARADWAAPALMRRAHPEASVAAVGLFGHRPEALTLADYGLAPYDFIVITEPDPERPDPCAGLRAAAEVRAASEEASDSPPSDSSGAESAAPR